MASLSLPWLPPSSRSFGLKSKVKKYFSKKLNVGVLDLKEVVIVVVVVVVVVTKLRSFKQTFKQIFSLKTFFINFCPLKRRRRRSLEMEIFRKMLKQNNKTFSALEKLL